MQTDWQIRRSTFVVADDKSEGAALYSRKERMRIFTMQVNSGGTTGEEYTALVPNISIGTRAFFYTKILI